jgi:hypothetical protein
MKILILTERRKKGRERGRKGVRDGARKTEVCRKNFKYF